jgi:hypothetical protein
MSQEVETDGGLHEQPDHLDQEGEDLEPIARVVRAEDVTLRRHFVADTSGTARLLSIRYLSRRRAGVTDRFAEPFAGSAR